MRTRKGTEETWDSRSTGPRYGRTTLCRDSSGRVRRIPWVLETEGSIQEEHPVLTRVFSVAGGGGRRETLRLPVVPGGSSPSARGRSWSPDCGCRWTHTPHSHTLPYAHTDTYVLPPLLDLKTPTLPPPTFPSTHTYTRTYTCTHTHLHTQVHVPTDMESVLLRERGDSLGKGRQCPKWGSPGS